jgi:hypothetical protein
MKQYHEMTHEEKLAEQHAAVKAASVTPEQRRAQRLADEAASVASQNWMMTEKRYEPSVENAARLHAAMRGKEYTEANLQEAFDYAVQHGIIKAKELPQRPLTLLEQAAARGITRKSIVQTPKRRLRELLADPYYKSLIEAVLASGE